MGLDDKHLGRPVALSCTPTGGAGHDMQENPIPSSLERRPVVMRAGTGWEGRFAGAGTHFYDRGEDANRRIGTRDRGGITSLDRMKNTGYHWPST